MKNQNDEEKAVNEIKALVKLIQREENLGFGHVSVGQPYSLTQNPNQFSMLNYMWVGGLFNKRNLVKLTKEQFESRLFNDALRYEYVEQISEGCNYWSSFVDDGKLETDTLLMERDGGLLLWFICYIDKSKK